MASELQSSRQQQCIVEADFMLLNNIQTTLHSICSIRYNNEIFRKLIQDVCQADSQLQISYAVRLPNTGRLEDSNQRMLYRWPASFRSNMKSRVSIATAEKRDLRFTRAEGTIWIFFKAFLFEATLARAFIAGVTFLLVNLRIFCCFPAMKLYRAQETASSSK